MTRASARAVVATAIAVGATACAPVHPDRGPPASRARDVLDQGVRAIGGADALAQLTTVRRRMVDHWVDTGQGQHPWTGTPDGDHLPVHFPLFVDYFLDYAGERWVESQAFDNPPEHGVQITAGTPAGGFEAVTYMDERPFSRELDGDDLTAQRVRRLRRFPEGILRMAVARAGTLQWIGDTDERGRRSDVVAFTDPAGTRVVLAFDPATHWLTRSQIDRDHAVLGDTTAETLYTDHRQVGALTLPFLQTDQIAGIPTHRWQIAQLDLGVDPPPAITAPRDAVSTQLPPPTPTLHPLHDGVFEILGPYNVMFAVFRDHVLLVEAPIGEPYTESCLDLIRSVAPDKPIRAVATHFHYDHIGGARTLVALGVPITTTPDGADVIRRAATAPHARHPDRLARAPRSPQLDTVVGQRVLEDDTQRVELHDVGPAPHVAQILVAYFARTRTLLVPDLIDVLTPEQAIPSDDVVPVVAAIKRHHLDVERIVPVHGVPVSIDDFHRGLAIRARHVPGSPLDTRPDP